MKKLIKKSLFLAAYVLGCFVLTSAYLTALEDKKSQQGELKLEFTLHQQGEDFLEDDLYKDASREYLQQAWICNPEDLKGFDQCMKDVGY